MTDAGTTDIEIWRRAPEQPVAHLRNTLGTKVVLALLAGHAGLVGRMLRRDLAIDRPALGRRRHRAGTRAPSAPGRHSGAVGTGPALGRRRHRAGARAPSAPGRRSGAVGTAPALVFAVPALPLPAPRPASLWTE
ncbi:hypothetical protein [Amycolatopsis sp. FDAARGOS 1241]|uniref:hypothetical protein n=1 Tax=Amycolatopsis sp. FDAARGOS 1241 TaxID=2778070 RepID=UPI00194F92E1|nr:hypothetical protein [Amycolatopsis sp. FDAARGOS 1241]QRP43847.1 hypothetical protein I6J71_31500 [Amycolatopsis sp. FDAARGOS 1241]